MAGKAGEAALQEKLDKIKGDYLALVDRVKNENVKAASDLEKKFLKDEEDFKKKQEQDRKEFEARLTREREDFRETQTRERSLADREAAERLRQAEEFIEGVRSPTTAGELAKLCPADLRLHNKPSTTHHCIASLHHQCIVYKVQSLVSLPCPRLSFAFSPPTTPLLRNELECPVCFAEMKPPVHIWQCAQVTRDTCLNMPLASSTL